MPSSLRFRQQARRLSADQERFVTDVTWYLNAIGADGITTKTLLVVLNDPQENNLIGSIAAARCAKFRPINKLASQITDLASRGAFTHCAVQATEPVMRYGKPMRPWLWYAEANLPKPPELPTTEEKWSQCPADAEIDYRGRLQSLARAIWQARKIDNGAKAALLVWDAAHKAVEGLTE